MKEVTEILKLLEGKGRRQSTTRCLVLEALVKNPRPLTYFDLKNYLASKEVLVNKTTIYRELDFLVEESIIHQLQLKGEAKYYELMPKNHHHHAVCTNCDAIDHVQVKEDFEVQEKLMLQSNNFKVLRHSLEFYGLCSKCQK